MTNLNEHIQTMSILLRATAKYIYKRIISEEAKIAYKKAIDACLSHIEGGWQSLDIIKKKIDGVQNDVDLLYKVEFLNKHKESRRYYLLGCEHAKDVIYSIEKRFIGQNIDFETTFLNNKKELFTYEDEGIF